MSRQARLAGSVENDPSLQFATNFAVTHNAAVW
jgi:hypothetical protein